jgi:hypothetical protein
MTFNNQSYTILFSLFLLLFLGSCEKDSFENLSAPNAPSVQPGFVASPIGEIVSYTRLLNDVELRSLRSLPAIQNGREDRKSSDQQLIDSILQTRAFIVEIEENRQAYTFYHRHPTTYQLYNFVFERVSGVFTSGMIYEIIPSLNTKAAINDYSWTSFPFDGRIKARPLNDLSQLFSKDLEDCFEIVFNGNWPSNGTGGYGNDPGGPSDPNWGPTRISTGSFPLNSPYGGSGGSSDPCVTVTNMIEVLVAVYNNVYRVDYVGVMGDDCNGDGIIDEKSLIAGKAGQKDKDCDELLEILGLILRPLTREIPQELVESIDRAAEKTPYDIKALYQIINQQELDNCMQGNSEAGGTCITELVQIYLESTVNASRVNTLHRHFTTVDNPETLSIFLNIVLGADGDPNVIRAAQHAVDQLNITSEQDLGDMIGYLSILARETGPDFSTHAPSFVTLTNKLHGVISLTQVDWVAKNPDRITEYLDFLNNNNDSEDAKDYALWGMDRMAEEENIRMDRMEELFELIKNNPDPFFEDCADEVEPWVDLASFVPSGDALDKLERLDRYVLQTIQNADSKLINLDRFAIKMDVLPFNESGARFTPSGFFDHIRRNIETFAPKFGFDDDTERDLWLSDDPYTAIANITLLDAVVMNLADGDVMCTQYSECCWIFSTLRGLAFESGDHPVSGNRKFGYNFDEESGEFEFYIQGADRVTRPWHNLVFFDNTVFDQGADFWNDFMKKLKVETLRLQGNVSEIPEPVSVRPVWNEIKAKLLSNHPLTIIPCGN